MTTQSNGQLEYKVVLVGTVIEELKRIHEELMSQGRGAAFTLALRKIYDRLRTDPRQFGEPLYRLPMMRLLVHQAIIIPVVVTYGVHDELPLVFVRVVNLLSIHV